MTTITDALNHARSEAQELHKKIEENTTKNSAALKADMQKAGTQAQQLAASLKATADGQRADVKERTKRAIAQLEDLSKHAHDAANAGEEQLKQKNLAMLERARNALNNLSHAVASERSAKVKA